MHIGSRHYPSASSRPGIREKSSGIVTEGAKNDGTNLRNRHAHALALLLFSDM